MARTYQYIIVIDTEFVSSKQGEQPFQISLIAFEIKNNNLIKLSDFNVFIMLKEGIKLNYFAKKYTGITDEKLKKDGIYPDMAINQVINFLLMFNIENTLIVGWAPNNDKKMLDKLINDGEPIIDLNLFDWFDLAKSYVALNHLKTNETPAFKEATESYHLSGFHFHDSMEDAKATSALLSLLLKEHGMEQTIYACQRSEKLKKGEKKKRYIKQRVEAENSSGDKVRVDKH